MHVIRSTVSTKVMIDGFSRAPHVHIDLGVASYAHIFYWRRGIYREPFGPVSPSENRSCISEPAMIHWKLDNLGSGRGLKFWQMRLLVLRW